MIDDVFKTMVNEVYEMQESARIDEFGEVRFTGKADIEDLAMLDVLAGNFFKRSRSELIGEIIHHAVESMWLNLNPSDRESLAEYADESIKAFFEKASIENKGGWWLAKNKAIKEITKGEGES